MFIAFEGPDNTGKTTSAANLSHDGIGIYNATKDKHAIMQRDIASEPDLVVTYDRIDWFTHMMYRLAMPDHEWNDARARTVFAMPDTHLVVKVHNPDLVHLISDELYKTGKLAEVNPVYGYFGAFMGSLNEARGYSLFKSVSIMQVNSDPRDKSFSQELLSFASPVVSRLEVLEIFGEIDTDEKLLEVLRYVDQCTV